MRPRLSGIRRRLGVRGHLEETSKVGTEHALLKRDDIGLADAINAALVQIDGVHTLVWSRPQARND